GLGQQPGRRRRGEGAEVEAPVAGPRATHGREPGEAFVEGELEVGVPAPALDPAVEGRKVLVDQAHLEHGRLEGTGAHHVVDGLHLPEELVDLPAPLAGEVRAHPRPQVGGLPDVEYGPASAPEEVDAGAAGEVGGEAELVELGMPLDGG